jgi:hypothetical protein
MKTSIVITLLIAGIFAFSPAMAEIKCKDCFQSRVVLASQDRFVPLTFQMEGGSLPGTLEVPMHFQTPLMGTYWYWYCLCENDGDWMCIHTGQPAPGSASRDRAWDHPGFCVFSYGLSGRWEWWNPDTCTDIGCLGSSGPGPTKPSEVMP